MTSEPRKFIFETVFDGAGDVVVNAPPRKAFYTADEVEQVRLDAFADGQRAAIELAQLKETACLGEIRQSIAQAMGALTKVAQDHCAGAAELALAAARKIADAALTRFPEAPAAAALEALRREVDAHPRLLVRASEEVADRMQTALDRTADAAGYTGQVTVKSDPALQGAAFVFEWGEGRAAFDPQQAATRVADALEAALSAEEQHREPLTLSDEAANV